MFGLENLDGWKLLVLLFLGIFIFGPDKLPKAISDGVRMLRDIRDMARHATSDLSRELGTDIQLEDLNPKTLLRKHILSEEDERALRKPLESLYKEAQADVKGLTAEIKDTASTLDVRDSLQSTTSPAPAPAGAVRASAPRRAIDIEAT
jgi:sec-independent protein translocase protein TatB